MNTATIEYFKRMARAWQNVYDTEGLLPGITLSQDQQLVIQQDEEHMLITGSAGSGKSIVLIAKLLKFMELEEPGKRILYVTFNKTLRDDAEKRLKKSPKYEELSKKHTLHMFTFHYMAYVLLRELGFEDVQNLNTSPKWLERQESLLRTKIQIIKDRFERSPQAKQLPKLFSTHTPKFLLEEFFWMKANGYVDKETYLTKERTGRGSSTPLNKNQRETVYVLFQQYNDFLKNEMHNYMDIEDYALKLLGVMNQLPPHLFYDAIFVDEVQDLQPMQIKVLAKLAKKMLVLTGDPKQRIYKRTPHSYLALGINIQGRCNKILRENFRSTKQIMSFAGCLKFEDLEKERDEKDIFKREGSKPKVLYFPEFKKAIDYIEKKVDTLFRKHEGESIRIAVIHRQDDLIQRNVSIPAKQELARRFSLLSAEQYHHMDIDSDKRVLFFTDVYNVKGLEFDYVFILDFDKNHYPLKSKVDRVLKNPGANSQRLIKEDLNSINQEEKRLLYVAITRAKKEVYLLWWGNGEENASPYLAEFDEALYERKDINI